MDGEVGEVGHSQAWNLSDLPPDSRFNLNAALFFLSQKDDKVTEDGIRHTLMGLSV